MEKLVLFLIVLGFAIAGSALSGWIIQLLWNWLMVSLFGLAVITFWQGWGIAIALSIVGGFFRSSK